MDAVDRDNTARMKEILKEIQSGQFAKEWAAEYASGLKEFRRMEKADLEHPIEKVGAELRARMSWINQSTAPKPAAG